jgi:sister chromatid cohesion protein DCC1
VALSLSHEAAPVEELVSTLASEHEISKQVSTQVISWFGRVEGGIWTMDTNAVLREAGLGILRLHKVNDAYSARA